jgi:hypothetical protein
MNTRDSFALGITVHNDIMEIYGANEDGAVTLQGWFDYSIGLAILAGRSPCIIATEANALPAEFLETLRWAAHIVMIVPHHVFPQSGTGVCAKSLCKFALDWIRPDGDLDEDAPYWKPNPYSQDHKSLMC